MRSTGALRGFMVLIVVMGIGFFTVYELAQHL